MALVTCKECGGELSTKAEKCPKCGAVRKNHGCLMAVTIFFGFIFLVAVLSPRPKTPVSSELANKGPVVLKDSLKEPTFDARIKGIVGRYKENQELLKKYYANKKHVNQAQLDVLSLTTIINATKPGGLIPDKTINKSAVSLLPRIDEQSRMLFASSMEDSFMRQGQNITVRASGKGKKELRLVYVLMSQPLVYKFRNDFSIEETARSFGFSRVVYSNGLSSLGRSWSANL
jgi:hypothetical protein